VLFCAAEWPVWQTAVAQAVAAGLRQGNVVLQIWRRRWGVATQDFSSACWAVAFAWGNIYCSFVSFLAIFQNLFRFIPYLCLREQTIRKQTNRKGE
jgi:hypothetical protein